MIKLTLAILSFFLFMFAINVCNWRFPYDAEEWNRYWRVLWIQILMIWGILIAWILLLKPCKYDPLIRGIIFGSIIGMVIPCIFDQYLDIPILPANRKTYLHDYVLGVLGFYSGLWEYKRTWHKIITVFIINKVSFKLLNGEKIYNKYELFYNRVCQKLR